MNRREQVLDALKRGPKTFPEIREITGMSASNASRVLDDAVSDGAVHRSGVRRKYVYQLGSEPTVAKRMAAGAAALSRMFT
jgi:DNA-binding IclR family transcriptional regulator